jgi:hypothetical protein
MYKGVVEESHGYDTYREHVSGTGEIDRKEIFLFLPSQEIPHDFVYVPWMGYYEFA